MTTDTTAHDQNVTLNGLDFHYREWGDTAAPPLLLLHGFTGHARSWETFAAAMADRFRVLALDQRGHGETEWAQDYAPERMVEDIEAFVQQLGLEQFSLLGLSMGGRNAYHFAAAHADQILRLVIVDIGPEIATEGSNRIRTGTLAGDTFASPDEAIAQARAGNARADENELRARVTANLKQTDNGQWTFRWDKALRSPDQPLPRPDAAAAWLLLPRITCPTLLVRGAHSDVLSLETAERMTREIPDCDLVQVPNAGHSIPLDNPQGFIQAVRPFLLEGIGAYSAGDGG